MPSLQHFYLNLLYQIVIQLPLYIQFFLLSFNFARDISNGLLCGLSNRNGILQNARVFGHGNGVCRMVKGRLVHCRLSQRIEGSGYLVLIEDPDTSDVLVNHPQSLTHAPERWQSSYQFVCIDFFVLRKRAFVLR